MPENRILSYDKCINLINFLLNNKRANLTGKFIHVNDNYAEWQDKDLKEDSYTLRRKIK